MSREGSVVVRSEPRNRVVLVDEDGSTVGEMEKLAAHQAPGHLHLAFSVFLYDHDGRLWLQRRAAGKYHFPLVWANSCCSHPQPGEAPHAAATARVREELGIDCVLEEAGSFVYRAPCAASGLVEAEYDIVFVGTTDGPLDPDPEEIESVSAVDLDELDRLDGPIAPWFAEALAIAQSFRTRSGN